MGDNRKLTLQGLLRFALEQTKKEDAAESTFQQMDEENKKFLEYAFKSMTVDVIEEFKKAITVLENADSYPLDQLNALSVIREYIDDIDFANNFVKVGGTEILFELIRNGDSQVRVQSLQIIAEMSQNNPFCQKHFIDSKVMSILIPCLKEKEDICSNALYATSALVRHYEPGLIEFLQLGGIHILISCISSNNTRVFVKTCFLIATLSSQRPEVRDEFVKKLAIEKLITCLEPIVGFDVKSETTLYAVSELCKSPNGQLKAEQKSTLVSVVNEIIEKNKDLPQCEEMVSYGNTILEAINTDVEN